MISEEDLNSWRERATGPSWEHGAIRRLCDEIDPPPAPVPVPVPQKKVEEPTEVVMTSKSKHGK